MKRCISLLLALMMALALLPAAAFAEEEPPALPEETAETANLAGQPEEEAVLSEEPEPEEEAAEPFVQPEEEAVLPEEPEPEDEALLEADTDPANLINAKNFPDSALRNRLNSLYPAGLDETDILSVVSLDLTGAGITNLTGIQLFQNLKGLNLSGNTRLKKIDCAGMDQLIAVVLQGCTAMEEVNCAGCSALAAGDGVIWGVGDARKLKKLDLSGTKTLGEWTFNGKTEYPCLRELDFSGCDITKLQMDGMMALKSLSCAGCGQLKFVQIWDAPVLETADFTGDAVLETCRVYGGEKLKSLSLSGCAALTEANVQWCGIPSLDLSACVQLENAVLLENSALSSLKLDCAGTLKTLDVTGSSLPFLDLDNYTVLTELTAWRAGLGWVSLLGCTALTSADLRRNHLRYVNVSCWPGGDEDNLQLEGQTPSAALTAYPVFSSGKQKVWMVSLSEILAEGEYANIEAVFIGENEGDCQWEDAGNGRFLIQGEKLPAVLSYDYDMIAGEWTSQEYFTVSLREGSGAALSPEETHIVMNVNQSVTVTPGFLNDPAFGPVGRCNTKVLDGEFKNPGEHAAFTAAETAGGYKLTGREKGTGFFVCIPCYTDYQYSFINAAAVYRVDVTDGENGQSGGTADAVTNVMIPEKKQTVQLYATDCTEFEVLLEMEQILGASAEKGVLRDEQEVRSETDAFARRGVAILGAEFADPAADALFELVPVDDGRLRIVPRYETVANVFAGTQKVNGTYRSAVKVIVGTGNYSKPFVTETMTLTVKKTLPKVKAKTVKLVWDSLYGEAGVSAPLQFTGGKVVKLEPDTSKAVPVPEFLSLNGKDLSVSCGKIADKTRSGSVYALATVKGCAVRIPVTLKVTVQPKKNTPQLQTAAFTMNSAAGGDSAVLRFRFKEKECNSERILDSCYSEIIEEYGIELYETVGGKKTKISAWDEIVSFDVIRYNAASGWYEAGFKVANPDGLAHTYSLSIPFGGTRKTVTIKVLPQSVKGTVTVKKTGSIYREAPGSEVLLQLTMKNMNWGPVSPFSEICIMKDGSYWTEAFQIDTRAETGTVRIRAVDPNDTPPAGTYTLIMTGAALSPMITENFEVIGGWKDAEFGVRLEGALDAALGTSVIVVPEVGYVLDRDFWEAPGMNENRNGGFYRKTGKTWQKIPAMECPFTFDNYITVTETDPVTGEELVTPAMRVGFLGFPDAKASYGMVVTMWINGKEYVCGTPEKPIPLKVAKTKPAIALDTKSVTLLAEDAFDTASAGITVKTGRPMLTGIVPTAGSSPYITVKYTAGDSVNSDGTVILGWDKSVSLQTREKLVGKTLTVKLDAVTFGYPVNKVLTLKVKVM